MNALVRFLRDFWWFCRRWHPVSVRWNSPRMLWRMAMKREAIKAAVLRSRAAIEADEANIQPHAEARSADSVQADVGNLNGGGR